MAQSDDPAVDRFYRAVGERVRGARNAARITQSALATRLGITRSSVANLEAGRQRIPLHTFAAIAECLGVTPAGLLPEKITVLGDAELSRLDERLANEEESTRDFVESALAQLIDPKGKE